ncbi:unnamed protein product [Auanema sp. JU1783]|nr:unnamed protein product [Auanema sp. JU1783]
MLAKCLARVTASSSRASIRLLSSSSVSRNAASPVADAAAAPLPSDDRQISPKISSLVEEIANLSLLDVSDLNWALKKRLNIPDQPLMAPGMMMAAAPAAAPAEAAAESDVPQKLTFTVKLTKFDDTKKIALIKEIRSAVPGLNLVQAKKFVETAPVVVKEDMGKGEADELKALLEKAGATIEIV